MTWGQKTFKPFGTTNIDAQAFLVGLVLAIASLAFLFLLNRDKLAIRENNPSLAEAQSIMDGRITLPERIYDSALYEDRILNVFQPGQTLFFLAHIIAAGGDGGVGYFQAEMFLIFVLTVFLFGIAVYRLSNRQALLSIVLAASLMFGAPYIASLPVALRGSVYRVNNVISILFVAAFLVFVSSKNLDQKLLLIGACIGAAMLFRMQYVLLLFLPLSLLLQDAEGRSWQFSEAFSTPAARLAFAGKAAKLFVFPLLAVIIIAGFQMARFHNPFETGYAYIYVGGRGYLTERARDHGLFSLYFLPENLYRTFLAFPILEFNGWRIEKIIGDPRGNSLLFSQPILLMMLFLRESLATARAKSFLFVSLLLAIPVWLYHNPGMTAHGYMRYSLDYLPLWIATVAVFASYLPKSRQVLWASVISAVWAILYGILLFRLRVTT